MRKLLPLLAAIGAVAGGVLSSMSGQAAAGSIVDPTTPLEPAPPPGAVCRADGPWVICQTTFLLDLVNEPIADFDLPCGTLYETIYDLRDGIRWYLDGKLVKRFVSQNADGTWSLSPSGAGPTVKISFHASWRNEYAVPGDESSGRESLHGVNSVSAPGVGVIAHIAGLDAPDGSHRGLYRFVDDPDVTEKLCAALTA